MLNKTLRKTFSCNTSGLFPFRHRLVNRTTKMGGATRILNQSTFFS
uniref:Uncharacterized protein n=1 Tax=Anguilla anguilla TaxID=7936 RepID=A0A0E9TSF5_ANGAN